MNRAPSHRPAGRIAFVGTGPGDPGLLTVRARDALAAAPLVVTDSDVPETILALPRRRRRRPPRGRRARRRRARPHHRGVERAHGHPAGQRRPADRRLGRRRGPRRRCRRRPVRHRAGRAFRHRGTRIRRRAAGLGARRGRRPCGRRLGPARRRARRHSCCTPTASHLRRWPPRSRCTALPAQTPVAVTAGGTTTTQRTVQATLASSRRGGDLRGPLVLASATRWASARSCRGGSRGRCTAGACSSRARRTRRAR